MPDCKRCLILGKKVNATKIWVQPGAIPKDQIRQTQNLCRSCFNYDNDRKALIPKAQAYADIRNGASITGNEKARIAWAEKWNRDFHSEMERLWEAR